MKTNPIYCEEDGCFVRFNEGVIETAPAYKPRRRMPVEHIVNGKVISGAYEDEFEVVYDAPGFEGTIEHYCSFLKQHGVIVQLA